MNIINYGNGHNFIQTNCPYKYFNRFKCKNCGICISQRKDDELTYGVTNSGQYTNIEFEMATIWESLSCNDIIIKSIL